MKVQQLLKNNWISLTVITLLLILIGGTSIMGYVYIQAIEQKNAIEKLRAQEEARSNTIREMELEQERQNEEGIQMRNDASIQIRNMEIRNSFVAVCEEKHQEILDMLGKRMDTLGCHENMSLCYEDYSYNLFLGWIEEDFDVENCIDDKIEILK